MILSCDKTNVDLVKELAEREATPDFGQYNLMFSIMECRLHRFAAIAGECCTMLWQKDLIQEATVEILYKLRKDVREGKKTAFLDFASGRDITDGNLIRTIRDGFMTPLALSLEVSDMFCDRHWIHPVFTRINGNY